MAAAVTIASTTHFAYPRTDGQAELNRIPSSQQMHSMYIAQYLLHFYCNFIRLPSGMINNNVVALAAFHK